MISSLGEASESHISAAVSKGTAGILNEVSMPSCQSVSVFMDKEAIEMTSVENNVSQHMCAYVHTYVCIIMYINFTYALIMCMFSFCKAKLFCSFHNSAPFLCMVTPFSFQLCLCEQ